MASTTTAPVLPSYAVVRTIDVDGTLLTHLPVADRIVDIYTPRPGWARYSEALAHVDQLRRIGGGRSWAIVVPVESLKWYEPAEQV